MTTVNTRLLKHGLRAYYLTHEQVAAQRRAEARRKKTRPDEPQLDFEEPQ
jgi:hypothetical protein